ncbi:hypothetical protein BKA70DRAFT_1221632 [Coprinopsis sp. MPI-PUGE-AT-0042]|nr:hypothetical protein BKA70DRAFT_1221632 [Coprinopsis sp. MPI-PUGE-AT-0042]
MATNRSLLILKWGQVPGRLFPDHWALFVQMEGDLKRTEGATGAIDLSADSRGDIINVRGDPSTGFRYEAIRNWRPSEEMEPMRIYHIGHIPSSCVAYELESSPSGQVEDTEPRSTFEKLVLENVPPPGISLRSAASQEDGKPGRRIALKNCQTWLREAVEVAIAAGILTLEEGAEEYLRRPE